MRRISPFLLLLLFFVGCGSPELSDAGRDGAAHDGADAPGDGADAAAVDAPGPDAPAALTDASRDAADDTGSSRIDAIVALLSATPADPAAIEAALHEVAWSEGWPLHEGARWLFVATFDDPPSEVHFTSDVNGWSTTSDPASPSGTGVHYWRVLDEASFEVSPEGAMYKWLVGVSDYRAPLEATAYGFDAFGRFGLVRPDPSRAHFEQFPDFVGTHLALPRTFRAYLPAGFVPGSSAAASMRTVLLHDGQNVFGPEGPFGGWQVDATLADSRFADVVAIAIDNAADRFDAYTHVADDFDGPGGSAAVGGRADDYLALALEEALPFFRDRYDLVAAGDSLAMMGSSLGGLVTAYAALHSPTRFGCGAALSPTLGWGSIAVGESESLITRWPSAGHGPVSLYLDTGGGVTGTCSDSDGDQVNDDGTDADNYCVTAQFRDVLQGLGYSFGVDLVHWHEPGALHNEAAWRARVGRALDACTTMGWVSP